MNLIDYESREEIEKNYITLIYEDKETRVSWYADTSIEDVRFAIICACDSLADGEFEAIDDKAKPININKMTSFKNGQIIFLKRKNTNKTTTILLDGKRKLQIQIEPLRHIEAQMAVKYMIVGSNLLKHTKKGYPHIRQFQLSSDLKRILWYTKSKKINESQVSFDSIIELSIGQVSDNFIRYPLKMLEEFSFSIYYKNVDKILVTLDLTCKDEREFDLWVAGIKALLAHFQNKKINKNELLGHSKSFRDQISKGNVGSCSKFLLYENINSVSGNKDNNQLVENLDTKTTTVTSSYSQIGGIPQKSLEKFIVSRNLNYLEISKLFVKLVEKIKTMKDEVHQLGMEDQYVTGKHEGYEMLYDEEAIVDDLDTQKSQMVKLFNDAERNLSMFLQQFIWYSKEYKMKNENTVSEDDWDDLQKNIYQLENFLDLMPREDFDPKKINIDFFLKELDIQLWKIEIDLENVGDIIVRIKSPNDKGILEKIKGIFKFFK